MNGLLDNAIMNSEQQPQYMCTSVLEVSDGKGRPGIRRVVLTPTHIVIQRVAPKDGADDADSNRPTHGSVSDRGLSGEGSFDSFADTDSPPTEQKKREVTLTRADGLLGVSVRGGAEHGLPLIISKLAIGTPAAISKQLYVGDAIISINGVKITKMSHDEAVNFLNASGPIVTLKLKYIPTAKPFLSPTRQKDLLETNLTQWETAEEGVGENWEMEKSVPLLFACLTRYLGGTDRLRCNAFEVRDAVGNISTGVIHCGSAYALTSWVKCVSDVILGLNNVQIKMWAQESQNEIFYVGWVWEGMTSEGKSPTAEARSSASSSTEEPSSPGQSWLTWKPKVLAIRGPNLYYMDYPPGVGSDWECNQVYEVTTTLLRVLNSAGEYLDERQHCFTLQIASENSTFPSNCARPQPLTLYLSTETRQELIKVETAWTKAVASAVKTAKKCSFPVWWGGKPCTLEIDYTESAFNLYRASSNPTMPIWTHSFQSLKGSSDDSRTRLTFTWRMPKPSKELVKETMECRDLHKILFSIHSFLLAKVVH